MYIYVLAIYVYIYMYLAISSSGMNFESYPVIEQGSKNHLLVS